ncbi:MAG: replicative DNA helicase [Granulosicoccus sp.]
MAHTPDEPPIPGDTDLDEYGVPTDASPEDFGIDPAFALPGNRTSASVGAQQQNLQPAPSSAESTRELIETLARRTNSAPPNSIEAEQAVLGSLMLDANDAFDKISDEVVEGDFYQHNHRLIFRAISALATSGANPDHVTVTGWLQGRGLLEEAGDLNYVGALAEVVPSAGNVKEYAGIVRERSVLRQLISVANTIADSAYDADGRTAKQLLDEAETRVFAIADQTAKSGAGFQDITGVLASAIERINDLFESDAAITGLSTGFAELDEKTSGLQKSDLIIVAGRPSMGKTTFAMNIAENAAMEAEAPVAIFSMEMPAEQLGMRMISSLGRVELQKLRTGRLAEQDWPRITSAITLLNQKKNVFIDDTPALTPTELRARSRRLARDNGLSLIVIDYLQLMQVTDSRENRATEISEISRSLKALAKELQVPIVALSQLNRSLEQRPDKRPVMSDLRESGAIEQDADVIMFIYRNEVYHPEDEASKGRAEILIRKQRNGPIGAVNLTFLGQYTRFENYSPEIMTGEFS